ncbi:LysR family transcriptional regulator [Xanthomonas nasturtii]|uniref:LysR family transcriptional regulator n=1 Tax=Xanthomonas nasturtii TaxID=1843581 RepID=A0A3E1KHU4_9XANT|nr:LysR family transcriptional regulator [Xanthomonas nasturtii]
MSSSIDAAVSSRLAACCSVFIDWVIALMAEHAPLMAPALR